MKLFTYPSDIKVFTTVFLSGPQQYMRYVEVLRKACNTAGKRARETPDRTFYDAIISYRSKY